MELCNKTILDSVKKMKELKELLINPEYLVCNDFVSYIYENDRKLFREICKAWNVDPKDFKFKKLSC